MEIVVNFIETSNNNNNGNDVDNLVSHLKSLANLTAIKENCMITSPLHLSSDHLHKLLRDKFNNATVIISVVILVLINFVVIAGNILVILAVLSSSKLRTVTNFFIVSLAVADFLVGIAVLPYSLTLEILDTWIFGEIWCQGWLVIDVWMCTASILNLCAISVDRYLAVTQPVRYRSIMTAKRAKYMIAVVWILSFIICFPLLVVRTKESTASASISWNGVNNPKASSHSSAYQTADGTSKTSSSLYLNPKFKLLENIVTKESLQNSIQNRSIHYLSQFSDTQANFNHLNDNNNNGQDNNSEDNDNDDDGGGGDELDDGRDNVEDNDLKLVKVSAPYNINLSHNTLHTAANPQSPSRSASNDSASCTPPPVQCGLFLNKSYVIYSAFGSFYIPMFVMIFFYWRIYLVAIRTTRALKRGYRTTKTSKDGTNEERLTLRIHRGYNTATVEENAASSVAVTRNSELTSKTKDSKQINTQARSQTVFKSRIPITIYKASKSNRSSTTVSNLSTQSSLRDGNTLAPVNHNIEQNGQNRRNSPGCQSTLSLPSTSSPTSSREGSAKSNKVALARYSKRTSKYQAKRFHAETKAAKTVGIIVGGFIVCWLPFFTVYLTRAFCETCISELLFSIFFWLGYCNSMINPCIYGLFSKDFRRAFRNILCRCRLREETSVSSLIRQIHMPTFFEDMPEEMDKVELQDY